MSRKDRIEQKLNDALNLIFLKIEDESQKHSVPKGSETHLKITAVSTQFNGLNQIDRHRIINQLMRDELQTGLHALSMHLHTAEEWVVKKGFVLDSPACTKKK